MGKLTTTENTITYHILLIIQCSLFVFSFSWELKCPQEKSKKNLKNQNGRLGNSEIAGCLGFSQRTNTSLEEGCIKTHFSFRLPFSFHLPFSEVSVMANLDVLLMKVTYIEDITRWREDMNFIFEWQNNILRTSAASE